MSWVSNDATTFDIDVNGTTTESVTQPYTLTGLVIDTQYQVKVRTRNGSDVGPWSNTVTFTAKETYTCSYIDADGVEQSVGAQVLTGAETTLYDGWYVAVGNVSFDHKIRLDYNDNNHVRIILADGATMSIGTSETPLNEICIDYLSSDNILSIYCQTNGTGTLAMYSNVTALDVYTVNIHGGHVIAQGGTNSLGIHAPTALTITGGNVHVTGGYTGIYSGISGTIALHWRNTSDRIYANSYELGTGGSLLIATGQYLYNGEEVISGNGIDLTKVNDKSLQPAVKIILPTNVTASGTGVINQTDGTYALPGAAVTLAPPTGYAFSSVSSDDVTISETEGVYSFTMPAVDVTITATLKKLLTNTDITVTIPAQEYTGSALTPAITVKDGETTLTAGTYYTVGDWSGQLINAGTYTATLTGIGTYDGTATATFTISQKPVTVTAKAQTVAVGGSISSDADQAELTGAVDGHILTAVTLTASSTESATTSGTITPSAATIMNGSHNDVTANYSIRPTSHGIIASERRSPSKRPRKTSPAGRTAMTWS